jgi:nucleotide sugar dehydrogenase
VSKPEVAEMVKLYENCQRMVCIAYANEMADACAPHGIDPYEVSRTAATKPFGYMPFSPGLGVGGACIPVNPYYLFLNNDFPLLKAATEKMWQRPASVADRLMTGLKKQRPERYITCPPKVLIVGVAFKPGQSAVFHSPAVAMIESLQADWNAKVSFADPLVDQGSLPSVPKFDVSKHWNKQELEQFDVVVVTIKQIGVDLKVLDSLSNVHVQRWVQ